MPSPVQEIKRELKDWFRHPYLPRRSHSSREVPSSSTELTQQSTASTLRHHHQSRAYQNLPTYTNEDDACQSSAIPASKSSDIGLTTSLTHLPTSAEPPEEQSAVSPQLQDLARSHQQSPSEPNQKQGVALPAVSASAPVQDQASRSQTLPAQPVETLPRQSDLELLHQQELGTLVLPSAFTETDGDVSSPLSASNLHRSSLSTRDVEGVAVIPDHPEASTHTAPLITRSASQLPNTSSESGSRRSNSPASAAVQPEASGTYSLDLHIKRLDRPVRNPPAHLADMSTNESQDRYEQQKQQAIKQIANVSKLLRDAINAALPVAPEQYLSIAVPGTVIDTRNIKDGGTFVWKTTESSFPPTQVMQAEAKLVDNMVPLSYVMLGNTGKSVARSYDRALDVLVARKANVPTGSDGVSLRSPGNRVYDDSMEWLTKVDRSGKTYVDLYIGKQKAWADEQTAWDMAKIQAKTDAVKAFPPNPDRPKDMSYVVKQQQYYNDWNQANYRKYKFAVQGRYIDWVANGYKYAVEQNFGNVDVDSIIARVESSKESLRNSTVVDADGANEVHLVSLTPKNWAELCEWKERNWFQKNDDFSLAQVDAEIERLEQLQISYVAMGTAMGMTIDGTTFDIIAFNPANAKYPLPGTIAPDVATAKGGLQTAFTNIYDAQGDLAKAIRKAESDDPTMKADEIMKVQEVADQTVVLNQKRKELADAANKHQDTNAEWTKWNSANMSDAKSQEAMKSWLQSTLQKLKSNIEKLEAKRDAKQKKTFDAPPVIAAADATDDKSNGKTALVADGSEKPNPIFGIPEESNGNGTPTDGTVDDDDKTEVDVNGLPQPGTVTDPWTTITASFSAKDQSSLATTSSWGMSVGGGAGWGLWSVGGSYAHDQSKSDFQSDMSACDVSVTFSALVVNIGRPWLYGELFADAELDVAKDFYLSPGPKDLKDWMSDQVKANANGDAFSNNDPVIDQLAKYNMFPAYPTSFVVAADTTVEFHGDTQHIEKHFSSQSNSGSVSVGWGPFSVSSSFHQSSSRESFQMQSTATGCRLTFGAPQIIGWVNQILPALPRLNGYEPMVQNLGRLTV